MMRNAGKIRETMEKASETLGQIEAEGSSGGGAVSAKVNGRMELISVKIDPKSLKPTDSGGEVDWELLEDLIVAAVNQGIAKAREAASESFSSSLGGMPMSGLSNLLGGGRS